MELILEIGKAVLIAGGIAAAFMLVGYIVTKLPGGRNR